MPQAETVLRALRAIRTDPAGYLRQAGRLALEREAAARITALGVTELAELTAGVHEVSVRLPERASRHGWSLGVAEQLTLQALIRSRGCRTAFEIGTFNGGTTRLIAEALPSDGKMWTIDLPALEFAGTQSPAEFRATDVGAAYRQSAAADKIVQLYGNSLEYDFEQYGRSADLVLVDAGHEYVNGFADTKTALRLIRSGGVILWDDFEPYWYGLVQGICDAMDGRSLRKLAGTSFAVYVDGEDS
jgi:predicted O-methyltransferase YrrM